MIERPLFPVAYTLSDREVTEVREYAQAITSIRRYGRDAYRNRVSTVLQDHEHGFGAEMAAHRVTGLPLRWQVVASIERRSPTEWDKLPDLGTRTEVKSTHWRSGHLIFRVDQDERPLDDVSFVFLLAIGRLPTYTLWGWMEGADLYAPHHRRLDRFGTINRIGYWASRSELDRFPLPADA